MRVGHRENKRRLHDGLARLAEAGPDGVRAALAALYAEDAEWRGAHPLNEMVGVEAIAATVWEPLLAAMPDLERRDLIVAGGDLPGPRLRRGGRPPLRHVRRRLARHPGDRTPGLPALRRGA